MDESRMNKTTPTRRASTRPAPAPFERVDPPAPREDHRTREWEEIASRLRADPGQWYTSPQQWASTTNVNSGRLRAFAPAGTFEAVRRKGILVIRFVGRDDLS